MNTVDRTYSRARDEKGWDMVELHSGSNFSWKVARTWRWDDTALIKRSDVRTLNDERLAVVVMHRGDWVGWLVIMWPMHTAEAHIHYK